MEVDLLLYLNIWQQYKFKFPIFEYMSYRYNDDVKINVASYFNSIEIKTCEKKIPWIFSMIM